MSVSSHKNPKNISPVEELELYLHYWWWLVVTAILGAGLGLAFSFARPPLYVGEAQIITAIDFNRTGALDDIARDQLLGAAEDLMTVPATFAASAEDAARAGYDLDAAEFRKIAVVERSLYTWTLRILHDNPSTASDLANIWANQSFRRLEEAYRHAVSAESLLRKADGLGGCLGQAAFIEPGQPLCGYLNFSELQNELEITSSAAQVERSAAMGLSTAMTYALGDPADPQVQPVRNSRAILLLAGTLIGLVVGVFTISIAIPQKILHRRTLG